MIVSGSEMGWSPETGEYRRGVSYVFEQTDAGRTESRRPRQRNDCTVRAYATAARLSYDDAYDLFAWSGRKCARGFDFRTWAKAAGLRWIPFAAVKGQKRVCLGTVADHLPPTGRYILRVAKHICAFVDGVVYDDGQQSPFRCVYGAWEIEGDYQEAEPRKDPTRGYDSSGKLLWDELTPEERAMGFRP